MSSNGRTVTLPHKPIGAQVEYYNIATRFSVSVVGRQWGKSTIAQLRSFRRAMQRPGVYYWISPIFQQARVQFERFRSGYEAAIGRVNLSNLDLYLLNNSRISFRGSDKPDSIKGDTANGATLDECGTMHPAVWPEVVRPMLGTTDGWADFIGTPKGRNWFWELWNSAAQHKDWTRFHSTSADGPFFSREEFEDARRSLPERIFRQEYLAEFLEDDSEVFRGITDCIGGELQEPVRGANYVIGADLAKTQDFTVLTCWDVRGWLVGFDRFNQISWELQSKRIANMAAKYNNALVRVETNGPGSPVYDRLAAMGVRVDPVQTTAQSKVQMVENLSMAIEKQEIRYPALPEIISELQLYSVERTASGHLKYGAPPGCHDDVVMSMAIAVYYLTGSRSGPIIIGAATEMSDQPY